jgi:hypothetical protein
MWGGPSSVLSHRAAARIRGFDGISQAVPELTVGLQRSRAPAGVVLHRRIEVPATMTTGLLRHTTLARTTLDLAEVLDDDTLELCLEFALRNGVPEADLRPKLDRVFARRPPGCSATESELETRYVQLVRSIDVPEPVRQYPVFNDAGTYLGRLDVCWPEVGLWVECDGRAVHDRPDALLRDRRRQNELATFLQFQPLRFTWEDVVVHPVIARRATEDAYHARAVRRSSRGYINFNHFGAT